MKDLIKKILREETSVNPKKDKLRNLIFKMINYAVEGVDVYYTINGSVWLIFTDDEEWVIELGRSGILWYNHSFFRNILKYIPNMDNMDVLQQYVNEWAEDFLNNKVEYVSLKWVSLPGVRDTIKSGIKQIHPVDIHHGENPIEDVIKYGLKVNKS